MILHPAPSRQHADMTKYSTQELRDDLADIYEDIVQCKLAIRLGVLVYGPDKAPVWGRLIRNRFTRVWVEDELRRRAQLS